MTNCIKCSSNKIQPVERIVNFPKDPRIQMRFRMVDCSVCEYTTATDEQRSFNSASFDRAWSIAFPDPNIKKFG